MAAVQVVEDKLSTPAAGHRSRGRCRPVEEPLQALPLPRAQMEHQVVAEVAEALGLGHADLGATPPGQSRPDASTPSSRAAAKSSSSPARSTPGRATHIANTNGKPGPARPLFAQVPDDLEAAVGPATCRGRRSASPRRPSRLVGRSADRQRPRTRVEMRTALAAGSGPRPRWCASPRPGPACGSARSARGCRASRSAPARRRPRRRRRRSA